MDHTTGTIEQMGEELMQVWEQPGSLSEMEHKVRRFVLWLGGIILGLWLKWEEGRYPPKASACPHCQGIVHYQRQREGTLHTTVGMLRDRRAYYTCAGCHQGHYPLDERLGLRPNAMSAELERLAGRVGVQMPFGKGSAVFEQLTLLSLSDQSLDKAAQAYGREVEQQESNWQASADDEDWLRHCERETRRPLRLYGTMDGTKVHIRGQEEDHWRELKLGAWFVARGRPPTGPEGEWAIRAEQITYWADICPAQQFGELLWATGAQRQAQLAQELIFLGDGAEWIWNLVEEHFPHAIQIVDWFHACEYVAAVSQITGVDDPARRAWFEQVRADLWHGRLEAVLAACAQLVRADRADDPAQRAVTYFTNNRHRMDYPTFRAQGYQIGSGTIESAAKQIGLLRLKVPGARWNLDSARYIAKARASFLSDRWDTIAARRIHFNRAA